MLHVCQLTMCCGCALSQLGLKGHTDYIHAVAMLNTGQECVTASEDGSVRIWDLRRPLEATQVIEPYKNENCARPQLGRWVGCVAVDTADDWMVCGGGPKLCLWHLRSLAATAVFDTPGVCQKTALFHDDSIISAGNQPFVHHWSVNGEERSKVPCSPTSIFSLKVNSTSENAKVLSVAGNCHKVDICTNFGYRAFSLETC
ncbi:hypothetical protein NP493_850g00038 [Ridgeia piscesae]|uniref:THO complex subunit 6 n=1 Tax=Ridgeia piscesae TaxID=27915 RepID=A0AAD9KN66_RIDPI|nr:hypothetical protein NP493_850g00038 [Ridgeia piscesae]